MSKTFVAGAELDDLVARKVMQWEKAEGGWLTPDRQHRSHETFQPSRDLKASGEVMHLIQSHWSPSLLELFHGAVRTLTRNDEGGVGEWPHLLGTYLDVLPEIVCRSALAARMLHRL